MKKFTVPCDFGGRKAPFTIYIGDPEPNHHPLHFQADWLSKERGGTIPSEVMDSIAKLYELSQRNNVSFEELCVYALNTSKETEIPDPSSAYQKEIDEFGFAPTPEAPEAPTPPEAQATPDEVYTSDATDTGGESADFGNHEEFFNNVGEAPAPAEPEQEPLAPPDLEGMDPNPIFEPMPAEYIEQAESNVSEADFAEQEQVTYEEQTELDPFSMDLDQLSKHYETSLSSSNLQSEHSSDLDATHENVDEAILKSIDLENDVVKPNDQDEGNSK